jgi:hypothetical protein
MAQITKHVGLDVHKDIVAVAVAEDGRDREVRFRGTVPNTQDALRRLVVRLAGAEVRLVVCYEAGTRHPAQHGVEQAISSTPSPPCPTPAKLRTIRPASSRETSAWRST